MKRAPLLVVLSAVLALTACGDSEGGAEATPTLSTTASPTLSQNPDVCPGGPREVPAFAGARPSTDLAVKPTVARGPAPRPTEVTYTDVVEGQGPELRPNQPAQLKYVGALYATGKEFDSSWSRGANETFALTACVVNGGAIDGFLIGPVGMKVGGRRQINIPASFGYGAEGQPPSIPKDADLIFIVDLINIGNPTPPPAVPPAVTPDPANPDPSPAVTPPPG